MVSIIQLKNNDVTTEDSSIFTSEVLFQTILKKYPTLCKEGYHLQIYLGITRKSWHFPRNSLVFPALLVG